MLSTHRFSRLPISLLLIIWIFSLPVFAYDEIPRLTPNSPVEREIKGGEQHSYQIELPADQYIRLTVNQKGINVNLVLDGPGGDRLLETYSVALSQGPAPLCWVAKSAGLYRITIQPFSATAVTGKYQIVIKEQRKASDLDNELAGTFAAFASATKLAALIKPEPLKESIGRYQAAATIFTALKDNELNTLTLNNIGESYFLLRDYQNSIQLFLKALPLWQALGERGAQAVALNNIGLLYNFLGERQKSLDYYFQALPVWQSIADRRNEALQLANIGLTYDALGEKQQSINYYLQALEIRRALGDRSGLGQNLSNIGKTYADLGAYQRAIAYYQEALPLRREVGDRAGVANTLHNLGWAYDSLDDRQHAQEHYQQALQIWQELNDRFGMGYTLTSLGALMAKQGQYEEAIDYYNRALPLRREIGDRFGEAQTLQGLGLAYVLSGRHEKGIELYQLALILRRNVTDKRGEAETLYFLSCAERDLGRIANALAYIEPAVRITEELRGKVNSQALRISYFATKQQYYDLYIELLMRQRNKAPDDGLDRFALEINERARARSLLEAITEANLDINQGVDTALIKRERELRARLSVLADRQVQMLNGKATPAQLEPVKKELDKLTGEYQQIEARIKEQSPRYASLTQPRTLTVQEIQRELLDDNTLLLEYALGEKVSYLWVISRTAVTSFELPARAELDKLARRTHSLLSIEPPPPKKGVRAPALNNSEYFAVAAQLSRQILAPAAALLKSNRLLIVADGALQFVPFAALPAPDDESLPLIANHEITNLPSASALSVLRAQTAERAPTPKAVAIFADPVFSKDDTRVRSRSRRVLRAAPGGEFPRLPATRREAETILLHAGGRDNLRALDFDANRALALSPQLADYEIVHFATHGLINSDHPELSGLMLSKVDSKGEARNGFISALDLFNLDLRARLVVLSACRTGLGKEVRGEGLVGLTRGFMHAGAQRIVVSMWNVSDQATADLMIKFYRTLFEKKELSPAAALRQAQLAMWQQGYAPYHWAAFQIYGEFN